jgi:hypothetical protein
MPHQMTGLFEPSQRRGVDDVFAGEYVAIGTTVSTGCFVSDVKLPFRAAVI